MVFRRIPQRVLERLRYHAERIRRAFGQFRNIDHRGIVEDNPHEYFPRGTRVREIDLSRTSIIPVALKWVHNATAKKTLRVIFNKVKSHNKVYSPKEYQLIMPKAYAIDTYIVAMSKEDYPSVEEVLEHSTRRGQLYFGRLAQKNRTTIDSLAAAAKLVQKRTGIRPDNLLVVGCRKGKFLFVPLIDLF